MRRTKPAVTRGHSSRRPCNASDKLIELAKLHSSHLLLIVAGVSTRDAPAVHTAALHGKALLLRHSKPLVVIVCQLLVMRRIVCVPIAGIVAALAALDTDELTGTGEGGEA